MSVSASPVFRETLARLGLEAHSERLAPYARVELGLVHDRSVGAAIGATRIGGAPDVPPGFEWPCQRWPLARVATWPDFAREAVDVARERGQAWTTADDLIAPIPFLLQVNLAELPRDPRLPERGVLAFFVAVTSDIPDDRFAKRVGSAVAYFPDVGELAPASPPPTADSPVAFEVPLRAVPRISWDIPYEDHAALEAALSRTLLDALLVETRQQVHALFPAPAEECAGPMPPAGHVALLRVHEDDDAGFFVGDASWVTFTIPEADLATRAFTAACASVFIG